MHHPFRYFICLLALYVTTLQAQAPDEQQSIASEETFSYYESVVLGVVEGITEYLPISSTGHLIITNHWLGLDSDEQAVSVEGEPIFIEEDGEKIPYTVKDAADAYAIIIQAGAILAVVILYWRRLLGMLMGLLGRDAKGLMLLKNLIVAFLPAAMLGPLLDDTIDYYLFNTTSVAVALAAGAVLMFWVERRNKKRKGDAEEGPDLHQLSIFQCLQIGLLQCVAMWPGTSRSMMTIVGGYLAGLSPARAAEFSFLLGLITLTAASGYRFLTDGEQLLQALSLGPAIVGILVATVSAAIAVKLLVGFLTRYGLAPFAWYRLALCLLLIVGVM